MKGYLIDPFKKTIEEVDYDGNFLSIYDFIDAPLFTCVRINSAADFVYVDDEGLLKPNAFFQITGYPNPLAGKGLVLGSDMKGDSVDPSVDLAWVTANVQFLDEQTVAAAAEAGAFNITVVNLNKKGTMTGRFSSAATKFGEKS